MARLYMVLLLITLLIIKCGGSGGNTTSDESTPVPETTAAGNTAGAVETKIIGISGGSMVLSDGRIEILVPAGAVSSDTELTAVPVTNNAFGGIGTAYRFGPEELNFSVPVTIKLTVTAQDTDSTAINGLGIACQDSEGYWNLIQGAEIDQVGGTISIKTSHFSDYALVAVVLLSPQKKTIRTGETTDLELQSCYPLKGSGASDWRGYRCDNYPGVMEEAVDWSVNSIAGGNTSVGTVSGSIDTAQYKAPVKKPSPETVNVSARIINSDMPALNQVRVYSQITVTEAGDFSGTITIDQDFMGTRFIVKIEDAVLTEKDDGPDETNYTLSGTAVISPDTFIVGETVYTLAENAGKVYIDDYGFKVLKTTPASVRWGFVEGWEYSGGGESLPVTINFSTSNCGDGDIPVTSVDDIDGSYTMPCYLNAGAEWSFLKK